MKHGPGSVSLYGPGTQATYRCACGESRSGDMKEASKLMDEHQDAASWRQFVDAGLNHRKVWIMGREVQL